MPCWHRVILVERDDKGRSFHVENATLETTMPILRANVSRETAIMTDEARIYKTAEENFPSHQGQSSG